MTYGDGVRAQVVGRIVRRDGVVGTVRLVISISE